MSVKITEQTHTVTVDEGTVRVVTAATQGPPGPKGDPGDADMSEIEDHIEGSENVHGIPDTSQLATQDDLANLELLPEPGNDGDVLTLADGSPTWAEPEGGGLDPTGEEVITGDWLFDRENLRAGTSSRLAIGLGASAPGTNSISVGYKAGQNSNATSDRINIGPEAGYSATSSRQVNIGVRAGDRCAAASVISIGWWAGMQSEAASSVYIGRGAGRSNSRDDRLMIHEGSSGNENPTPLIDGRFRSGTDPDDFEYSKGVKINGHLEVTDQLILHSPDGTRWAITVDDSGNLSATEASEEITP